MKNIDILLLSIIWTTAAIEPTYECAQPCVESVDDTRKQFIFCTKESQNDTITLNSHVETEYTIHFPQKYLESEVDVHIDEILFNDYVNFSSSIDPYFQILKYQIKKSTMSQLNITVVAKMGVVNWMVTTGRQDSVTLRELFLYPMNLVLLHGYYWSNRLYDWIFFLLNACIIILYISSCRSKQSVISSLALYSFGAFTASFCAKLYHIIFVSVQEFDSLTLVFSICIVGLCFDIFPSIFALIHFRFHKKHPLFLGVFNALISLVFMFVGGGYYLGSVFLLLSSLFVLVDYCLFFMC